MPGSRHCQKLRQSAASGTAAVELASKLPGLKVFVLLRCLDKILATLKKREEDEEESGTSLSFQLQLRHFNSLTNQTTHLKLNSKVSIYIYVYIYSAPLAWGAATQNTPAAGHQFNGTGKKEKTQQTHKKKKKNQRSILQSIWLVVAGAVWMIYPPTDGSACQTLKNLRPCESISSALYRQ